MMRIVRLFFIHSGRRLANCVISDARALFERVIPNFPPERARPLWERWARYEYQYGDLEASLKLEKRMAEVYASGTLPVS
jgi:cleavage stimulation factor subunit 3